MSRDQQAAWLRLFLTPGIGSQTAWRLLDTFKDAAEFFAAPHSLWQTCLNARQIAALQAEPPGLAQAITLHLDWLEQAQHFLLTPDSPFYPTQLRHIPDPPLLLFAQGNPAILARPALAIVGSRHASQQGLRNAQAFARDLASAGLMISSGLAAGIDTAAHQGALAASGLTCAVVGTGLLHCYPASNRELARQIASSGCVLSEYALTSPAIAANFPRRNRLISGLSLGVLVVEAAAQSGSLITARMANEQGREVFAIPGSIHTPHAKGCHQLIRDGAKLVENSQHILEELQLGGWTEAATEAVATGQSALFAWLSAEPMHIAALERCSGWSGAALSAELMQLELAGDIESLPGGWYRRLYQPA